MVGQLYYFGSEVKQNTMLAEAYGRYCSPHGSQETERGTGRKGPVPVTYFFQTAPLYLHNSVTSRYLFKF
jgi:hypothetical protein